MEGIVEEVLRALDLVYNRSSSSSDVAGASAAGGSRDKADKFLQEFQQTHEAWAVADTLLRRPGVDVPTSFFAAMTMHNKIRFDFGELPAESIPSLKASLLDHIVRYANAANASPAVLTRLCLALAALAVQACWSGAVGELSSTLLSGAGMGRGVRAVLELMKVLPEECNSSRIIVRDATRDAFNQELCNSVPTLFRILEQLWADPQAVELHKVRIFQCLQSWIRHTDVPPESVASLPLLSAAFDSLKKDELFESAIDLLVEVLRTYDEPSRSMPIVHILVPRAMACRDAYLQCVSEEDEDAARGYCRLLTEMGESYMDLVMGQEDVGQVVLVEMLLMCTTHPEPDVAAIPLHFWYRLSRALERLEPKELQQAKLNAFGPYLSRLVDVLGQLLRYPADFEQLRKDQADDVRKHRHDVADVLNDCCRVLGGPHCLMRLTSSLEMEVQNLLLLAPDAQVSRWHGAEACLYGIKSIAKAIPSEEGSSVRRVMNVIMHLPKGLLQLRVTASGLVGAYSHWLHLNPSTVEPCFRYLLEAFAVPKCSSVAASSIRLICESCGQQLGEPVLSLHSQLQVYKEQGGLNLKDELDILQGLCHILSTLPVEKVESALPQLVGPIGLALNELTKSGGGAAAHSGAGDRARALTAELDRLVVVLRYVKPKVPAGRRHPILWVMQQLWQALGDVVTCCPSSDAVAEHVCRCYKHAMRNVGAPFEPLLQALVERIVGSFAVSPHSSFIYCGSICVGEFGSSATHLPLLRAMVELFSSATFKLLQSDEQFVRHPDVVEEYFYLLARLCSSCPGPLLGGPNAPSLVQSAIQCGIMGMRMDHREALRGVMHFFEEFIELILDGESSRRSSASDEHVHLAKQAILGHGKTLVHALVMCMASDLPPYAIDGNGGSVGGVVWKLHLLCSKGDVGMLQQWIVAALGVLHPSTASDEEKQEFMVALFMHATNKDDMLAFVRHFSSLCSRNRRRWNRKAD